MVKFSLSFKTPDVTDSLDVLGPERMDALELVKKYVKYNEYVTLEFDTENDITPIRVIPVK